MRALDASEVRLPLNYGVSVIKADKLAKFWHSHPKNSKDFVLHGRYISAWVGNDWVFHNAVWCVCLNVLDPPAPTHSTVHTGHTQWSVSTGNRVTMLYGMTEYPLCESTSLQLRASSFTPLWAKAACSLPTSPVDQINTLWCLTSNLLGWGNASCTDLSMR